MSTHLRNIGTAATLLPRMKRAQIRVGTEVDAPRTVALVPDANRPSSGGDDQTGASKLYLYISNDIGETEADDRSSWSLGATLTTTVTALSATQSFLGAMTAVDNLSGDNCNIYIAYQGSDSSLWMMTVPFDLDTGTFGTPTDEQVVAGSAVTNRYRAIDISARRSSTDEGTPAIAVYEADASTGEGAHIRVYVRNDDGTTWRQAYSTAIMTTEFIRDGSEDVAIDWRTGLPGSPLWYLGLYYTNTRTSDDQGDTLVELSYNYNTGTDGSASVVITWATGLNANSAPGSRRGWIFRDHTYDAWYFGGIVGLAAPFYTAIKLRHNNAVYYVNRTQNLPSSVLSRKYGIVSPGSTQTGASRACVYTDHRMVFGFVGTGVGAAGTAFRSIVFRFDTDDLTDDVAVAVDEVSRVLDAGYVNTPLALYGGPGHPTEFLADQINDYTWVFMYGASGDTVGTTQLRRAAIGIEDKYDIPNLVLPANSVVSKAVPDFHSSITPPNPYPNAKARLQYQVVEGEFSTFATVDVGDFVDFTSLTGQIVPQYFTDTNCPALETNDGWAWQGRVATDLGNFSFYSQRSYFSVLHQPAVLTVAPSQNQFVEYKGGNLIIRWTFTDTEPTDAQTSYQIVLTRLDTGATVTDTGKVASSSTAVSISVASTLVGVPLSYRVTTWDMDDVASTPSDPVKFTLNAAPVVYITSPASGGVLSSSSPVVQWVFSAPSGRAQSYYRVIIQNIDESPYVLIADSGWVAGVAAAHAFTTEVLSQATNYRVVVYVRDSLGISAHSEINLVPNPSFELNVSSWTATNCTLAQSSRRAYDETGAAALDMQTAPGSYSGLITPAGGSNPVLESTSFAILEGESYTGYFYGYSVAGWNNAQVTINWRDTNDASVSSHSTSVSIPAGAWTRVQHTATAPGGAAYARILVTQTNTPATSDLLYIDNVHMQHSPVTFTATWTPPVDGDISLTHDQFKVTLGWTDANIDPDFLAWRVYRKYNKYSSDLLDIEDTANTWVMIHETTDVDTTYEYRDYFAPLNKQVQYIVVQVVDRSGSQVESTISAPVSVTILGDRYYFVPAVPIGSIASFEAHGVTADGFSREIERETLHVIGRGRQVQVGDDLGYAGSFTIHLRNPDTARSDREFVELLCAKGTGKVYVRSPFGDVVLVNFGNPTFNRMAGVGAGDLGDLTLPYVEIYDEVPIRRAA